MKGFKKLFLLTAAMVFAFSLTALAAEITAKEQTILDELNEGVVVDGDTVSVPQQYLTQAESFLMKRDLTDDQVDAIIAKIKEAKAYLQSQGLKGFKGWTQEQVNSMTAIAQEAADVVDVTVSVDATTGEVSVTDNTDGTDYELTGPVVQVTGMDINMTLVVIAALVATVASVAVIAGKKKVFEA